jgi:hypothetical protein
LDVIRGMQQLMLGACGHVVVIVVGVMIRRGNQFSMQGMIQLMMKPLRAHLSNTDIRDENREHQ